MHPPLQPHQPSQHHPVGYNDLNAQFRNSVAQADFNNDNEVMFHYQNMQQQQQQLGMSTAYNNNSSFQQPPQMMPVPAATPVWGATPAGPPQTRQRPHSADFLDARDDGSNLINNNMTHQQQPQHQQQSNTPHRSGRNHVLVYAFPENFLN